MPVGQAAHPVLPAPVAHPLPAEVVPEPEKVFAGQADIELAQSVQPEEAPSESNPKVDA